MRRGGGVDGGPGVLGYTQLQSDVVGIKYAGEALSANMIYKSASERERTYHVMEDSLMYGSRDATNSTTSMKKCCTLCV